MTIDNHTHYRDTSDTRIRFKLYTLPFNTITLLKNYVLGLSARIIDTQSFYLHATWKVNILKRNPFHLINIIH
jgi:hypothetical protein